MKLQLDANELFLARFFKVGDISQKFKLHWKESDRNSSGNKDLQADLSLDRKANFFCISDVTHRQVDNVLL